jgi:glycerol uptake facilitator-like aquaporin
MVHPLAITAAKTLTVVFGGLITLLALRAYRRTGAHELRALAVGFGIVTIGAVLAGVTDVFLNVGFETSVLVESVVTVIGFGIITYSLYAE